MDEGDSGEMIPAGAGHLELVRDAGDEARRIRESIDDARAQIARSLETIQDEVEETLDWKGWVNDNPWTAVGIACAVGFYIGLR